jgi:hypothetical protein
MRREGTLVDDTTKGRLSAALCPGCLLDPAPQLLRGKAKSNLLTIVPAVPGTQGSPSGPRLVIGLRVVGISGFCAAPGARTAIN